MVNMFTIYKDSLTITIHYVNIDKVTEVTGKENRTWKAQETF